MIPGRRTLLIFFFFFEKNITSKFDLVVAAVAGCRLLWRSWQRVGLIILRSRVRSSPGAFCQKITSRVANRSRTKIVLIGMGFEPTPPKRLVPETSALDRSAIQPMPLPVSSRRIHERPPNGKRKKSAPAGNQTRVSSVAGTYTITVLPALIECIRTVI